MGPRGAGYWRRTEEDELDLDGSVGLTRGVVGHCVAGERGGGKGGVVGMKMLRPEWLLCELYPLWPCGSKPNPDTNTKIRDKFRQKDKKIYLSTLLIPRRACLGRRERRTAEPGRSSRTLRCPVRSRPDPQTLPDTAWSHRFRMPYRSGFRAVR
jgi:hypothetical protein